MLMRVSLGIHKEVRPFCFPEASCKQGNAKPQVSTFFHWQDSGLQQWRESAAGGTKACVWHRT